MMVKIVYDQLGKVLAASWVGAAADDMLPSEGERIGEFSLPDCTSADDSLLAHFETLRVDVERRKLVRTAAPADQTQSLTAALRPLDPGTGTGAQTSRDAGTSRATELFRSVEQALAAGTTREFRVGEPAVIGGFIGVSIEPRALVGQDITLLETRVACDPSAMPRLYYTVRNNNTTQPAAFFRVAVRIT